MLVQELQGHAVGPTEARLQKKASARRLSSVRTQSSGSEERQQHEEGGGQASSGNQKLQANISYLDFVCCLKVKCSQKMLGDVSNMLTSPCWPFL